MNIRPFEINDIDNCSKDFLQTFNASWNEDWDYEHAHEYITDTFNHPKFVGFILSDNNEDICYAMCYKKYWWSKDNRYDMYLELLFTKPEKQNKGYGKVLFEYIESYAKEQNLRGVSFLTISEKPSHNFYISKGYNDNKHLVIMGKWM